jgi:hypothetical protein
MAQGTWFGNLVATLNGRHAAAAGLLAYRNALSALRITATSIASWMSAPWTTDT